MLVYLVLFSLLVLLALFTVFSLFSISLSRLCLIYWFYSMVILVCGVFWLFVFMMFVALFVYVAHQPRGDPLADEDLAPDLGERFEWATLEGLNQHFPKLLLHPKCSALTLFSSGMFREVVALTFNPLKPFSEDHVALDLVRRPLHLVRLVRQRDHLHVAVELGGL